MFIVRIVLALALAVFATGVQAQPDDISKKQPPMEARVLQEDKTTLVVLVPVRTNSHGEASLIMGKMREAAEKVCPGSCTKKHVQDVEQYLREKKSVSVIKVEVRKP